MAQKTIDTSKFESLFSAAKKFFLIAQESMEIIDSEITKMDDPAAQEALSGGRGEAIKDALKETTKQVRKLDLVIDKAAQHINNQLNKIPGLQTDKNGLYQSRDSIKASGANMTLKRK